MLARPDRLDTGRKLVELMFRGAKAEDIPALVEMGASFHGISGLSRFVAFEPLSFEAALSVLIDDGLLLVLERGGKPVGMAGVFVAPAYYNRHAMMAGEMFWWIDPEHRGHGIKMLAEVEARVRKMGVDVLHMGCMETMDPDGVAKLYRRAGYTPVERTYYKRLS